VIFRGKLLVERSKEPEFDAARALLAKGITGKLTLLDGKTGKPRIVIDIEQLAQLCVKEGPLRFAPYESRPDRSPAAETEGWPEYRPGTGEHRAGDSRLSRASLSLETKFDCPCGGI
jgi:hypothetical protein